MGGHNHYQNELQGFSDLFKNLGYKILRRAAPFLMLIPLFWHNVHLFVSFSVSVGK